MSSDNKKSEWSALLDANLFGTWLQHNFEGALLPLASAGNLARMTPLLKNVMQRNLAAHPESGLAQGISVVLSHADADHLQTLRSSLNATIGNAGLPASEPEAPSPERVRHSPPALAELMATALCSPKKREGFLQCLDEHFYRDAADPLVGPRRARVRYWGEVLNSVGPLIGRWALRWSKRLGIAGMVIAALKRLAGG